MTHDDYLTVGDWVEAELTDGHIRIRVFVQIIETSPMYPDHVRLDTSNADWRADCWWVYKNYEYAHGYRHGYSTYRDGYVIRKVSFLQFRNKQHVIT